MKETISDVLKERLEKAFPVFISNKEDSKVIAQLVNLKEGVKLYLIAKGLSTDRYYGIIETDSNDKFTIMGISESNIKSLKVEELPMVPFYFKKFMQEDIKIS